VGVPDEVDIVCGHAEELAAAGLAHQVEEHAVTLQAVLQILGILYKTPKKKNYDGAGLDVTRVQLPTIFQVITFLAGNALEKILV
jgi:CobQ-like glutamine amidotransferase family enzyme